MRVQGYNVVGVDIVKPTQDDESIGGGNFHFVQADVGVVTEAERIVNEAVQRYGDKINVLVNNAGMNSCVFSLRKGWGLDFTIETGAGMIQTRSQSSDSVSRLRCS